MNMEWSQEFTLQFLEVYRNEVVLWDPAHGQHKDKSRLNGAWFRLSEKLNRPVAELKRKKDSLMATFRGHLRKKKASIRRGAREEDVYKPVWFAYDYMEEFLAPVVGTTRNTNTEISMDQAGCEPTEDAVEEGIVDALQVELTEEPHENQSPLMTKRRREYPQEIQEALNHMNEALNTLQNFSSNSRIKEKEEDECDLYGRMLAKKLRKLPEEEREHVMYEIDGIFVNRWLNRPQ